MTRTLGSGLYLAVLYSSLSPEPGPASPDRSLTLGRGELGACDAEGPATRPGAGCGDPTTGPCSAVAWLVRYAWCVGTRSRPGPGAGSKPGSELAHAMKNADPIEVGRPSPAPSRLRRPPSGLASLSLWCSKHLEWTDSTSIACASTAPGLRASGRPRQVRRAPSAASTVLFDSVLSQVRFRPTTTDMGP